MILVEFRLRWLWWWGICTLTWLRSTTRCFAGLGYHVKLDRVVSLLSGWCFQTFVTFHNIYGILWDNPSHWLSYVSRWLKHVKTTHQPSNFQPHFQGRPSPHPRSNIIGSSPGPPENAFRRDSPRDAVRRCRGPKKVVSYLYIRDAAEKECVSWYRLV